MGDGAQEPEPPCPRHLYKTELSKRGMGFLILLAQGSVTSPLRNQPRGSDPARGTRTIDISVFAEAAGKIRKGSAPYLTRRKLKPEE